MPAWSPDGAVHRLRHVDDDRRAHQAGGGRPAARRETLTRTRATTSIPRSRPTARRVVFLAGAASDQLYSILLDTPPPDARRSTTARRRDRRRQPAQHARDSLDAGRRRRADARRVGAERPRAAFRAQRLDARLPHDQPRPAVDHAGRLRPPHAAARHGRRPRQQPAGRRRDSPVARRHARVRQPAGQALPRDGAARRPRDASTCASRAAPTTRPCPVKRMSLEGGDYLDWTRRRHGGDLGARARSSSGRPSTPPSRRRPTSSSSCRARGPTGSVLLTGARIITMKGDEVHRAAATCS